MDGRVDRSRRIGGLVAALLVSSALTSPLLAAGGASQSDPAHVAPGGIDVPQGVGGAGGNGSVFGSGGGGGGGGANGGDGGAGHDGVTPGGAGGNWPGTIHGSAGGTDSQGYGTGGGGGGSAYFDALSYMPGSSKTGGYGGAGGSATTLSGHPNAVGGGGGAGGYGAVLQTTASRSSDTLSDAVALTGGNGGAGGAGLSGARGGNGGGGGAGLAIFDTRFSGQISHYEIYGTLSGGTGGAGGANGGAGGNGGAGLAVSHAQPVGGVVEFLVGNAVTGGDGGAAGSNGGVAGLGGAGVEGSWLRIKMLEGGSIAGGMSGDSLTRGNAVNFTAGTNNLIFTGATSQMSGNINLGTDAIAWLVRDDGATVVDNAITGSGAVGKDGAGTITLAGANTYTNGTYLFNGTLMLSGAGTLGDASGVTRIYGATLDLGGTTQTQSQVTLAGGTIQNGGLNAAISSSGGTIKDLGGTGSLTTTGGTTTLLGTNSYGGATAVNGGTLIVQGAITGTSSVAVNDGGTLTGTGLIDPPFVSINSGGTLMPGDGTPGSFTTIAGSLAFQSGSVYIVQVDPSTASYTKVIAADASPGAVTIDSGATVNAVFANGGYIAKRYTILTTTDGRTGTFAPTVTSINLPADFHTTLGYDANNVYLDLALNFEPPPGRGLNRNQRAVGDAIVNSFNTNGGIAMVYGGMTAASLTQASGEVATGAQQAMFGAMGQFLGVLTDPAAGCASPAQGGDDCLLAARAPAALGYATDPAAAASVRKRAEEAFAMFAKAPSVPARDPRWSVWATGFGGTQTTDGNAAVGSSSATSRIYGTAVGADYRISPNTVAGFAMAGGGTSFGVGDSGSGRSDLFQAGAYLRHVNGAAYLSAALAYGWQDITTDRTVTIAGVDRLRAKFSANAWSGRVEGGYRIVAPWIGGGITPYAAAQVIAFDLPSYAEQVLSGTNNFALGYAAKSVSETRSELGLRTDRSFALDGGVMTLRGRLAWAHDFNPDRAIAASFLALPGASFVTNGAALASDALLTTASAEMKLRNGWSLTGIFEGEFSNVTRSYAGKGSVRYAW